MSNTGIQDVVIPEMGESITTAFIGKLIKKPGQGVTTGDSLMVVDSDKASMELPSPCSGVLVEWLVEEGDEVPIGTVIARIDADQVADKGAEAPTGPAPKAEPEDAAEPKDAAEPEEEEPEEEAAPEPRQATRSDKGPQTGPAARQAAAGKGVDIGSVEGSGVRGRVLSRDVEAAAPPERSATPAPPERAATPAPPAQTRDWDGLPEDRYERVPMTPLRRTIARRLAEAHRSAAMLTTFNEVDMTNVMAIRKRYQDRFVDKYGIKLGFMSFFVKAAIEALKAYPAVNAEIDDQTDASRPAIVYKRFYNIGVAVSTDRGLVVPVMRDADRLSFADTEQTIAGLAKRARDNQLILDDFKDGTFTISNGGVFGSLMSTPILNPPQVGVLGMHSIQDRPIAVDGQVVIRPMMYLALTYDHRIIDGREAVSFLFRIRELVENPDRLLLEV